MITAGATPTPKTIDQRRVALTSPQVKTLQTDNAGTLRDAVRNARNAQDANTASPGLRYLHGFHRWREVRPRGQPIPQPIQVVFQVLLELLDRLPVHTC